MQIFDHGAFTISDSTFLIFGGFTKQGKGFAPVVDTFRIDIENANVE